MCTQAQKDALEQFENLASKLGAANNEHEYDSLAKQLQIKADALIVGKFVGKHLAEIKELCGGPKADHFGVMQDFFNTALFASPHLFKGDENVRETARALLKNLLATRLLAPSNFSDALHIVEQLIYKDFPESIPDVLNGIIIPFRNLSTPEQNNLASILDTLVMKYGPTQSILLPISLSPPFAFPNDWLSEAVQSLVDRDPTVVQRIDAQGKTILHRLFEKQFSFSTDTQRFDDPKSMMAYLYLPEQEGFADEKVVRLLPTVAKPAQFIIDFARKISAIQDSAGDTVYHVLVKNNRYDAKDTDVRFVLERGLTKNMLSGGADLNSLSFIKNNDGKRVSDYPPLVEKKQYESFLSRYLGHALNQFAASFAQLANAV